MAKYVIDTDIPIPTMKSRYAEMTAHLEKFKPGNSTFFVGMTPSAAGTLGRLVFGKGKYATRLGRTDEGEEGARIWRLE